MNKTNIALKSTGISLFVFLIQGILTFWRMSVIISVYGVNVNSIIQATGDVFSYLVLLESGLGAAYLYKMYKPLANNDQSKVYSLYLGLQRKLKKVSIYMVSILVLISFVYPYFLGENDVPYVKSTLIIILLGLRFVFPYYFTVARKNLLKAEERQYIVTFVDGSINSVILFGEIVLARYLGVSIEVTLSIGLVVVIFSNYIYKKLIKKKYGHFSIENLTPSYEGDEMTNDIIVHQIAYLANSHIDVFILSLIDLPAVTVYAAYNTAISYPTKLVTKIVENIRASIGLKISTDDKNMYSVFRELLSISYFIAVLTVPVFVLMINDFIGVWIGEQYVLGIFSVVLFSLILFHKLVINLIYIVRDGKGLYKESKVFTVMTTVTNIALSIILAREYSINGLLVASVLSNYLILDYGNLKLVYNKVFDKSYFVVIKDYTSLIIIILLTFTTSDFLINNIFQIDAEGWQTFLLKSALAFIFSLSISFSGMFLMFKSFRIAFKRIYQVILKRP